MRPLWFWPWQTGSSDGAISVKPCGVVSMGRRQSPQLPSAAPKCIGGKPWDSLRGCKFTFCPWRVFPGKAEGFQVQETLLTATVLTHFFYRQD